MKDTNANLAGLVITLLGSILLVALRCGWIKWDQSDKAKHANSPYVTTPYQPVIPPGSYQVTAPPVYSGYQSTPGYAGGR